MLGATGARARGVQSLHSAVEARERSAAADRVALMKRRRRLRHRGSRALLETLDASLRNGDRAEAISLVLASAAQVRDKDAGGRSRRRGRGGADAILAARTGGRDDPILRDDPTLGEGSDDDDDDDDDDDAWNALLARRQRLGRGRGQGGLDRFGPDEIDEPLPPELASRAFDVMVATHAAYESSKLDSLRRPALAPLNALCTALATTLRRSAPSRGHRGDRGRLPRAPRPRPPARWWARRRTSEHRRWDRVPDVTAALELALGGVGSETWAGLVPPPAVAAEMAEMTGRDRKSPEASAEVTGNGPSRIRMRPVGRQRRRVRRSRGPIRPRGRRRR